MRKSIATFIIGVALLAPWPAHAATSGEVLQADPSLLQTWWTSLNVRDGVRERDEVRIEHNGQQIADGLVVSVQGDHSAVMLRGNKVPTLAKGDQVVLVRHAQALAPSPRTVAVQGHANYKVVGGHAFFQIQPFTIPDDIGQTGSFMGGDNGVRSDSNFIPTSQVQVSTYTFDAASNFSAQSNWHLSGFSSPSFESTFNASSRWSASPTFNANSTWNASGY